MPSPFYVGRKSVVSTSLNIERSQIQSNRVDGSFTILDELEMLDNVWDKIKKEFKVVVFNLPKSFSVSSVLSN